MVYSAEHFFCEILASDNSYHVPDSIMITYNRVDLLSLRDSATKSLYNIPKGIKLRKRGNRGGVRVLTKKIGFNPYLPVIITGNVRSLYNKMDELSAWKEHDRRYETSRLLCFTETWLHEDTPEANVKLEGFHVFREDRNEMQTGKKSGGCVCIYVNSKWCHPNNSHSKFTYCDPNVELITITCRPYYLPRGFSNVLVTCVYIPPSANYTQATERLGSHIHDLMTKFPDAMIVVTGDFNQCNVNTALPGLHQHITCSTRGNNTLDLCYTNINNAYICHKLCPLGNSDHHLMYLRPKYKPLGKREPPAKRTVLAWTPEVWDTLRGEFDTTDWSMFVSTAQDVNELAETVCSYINFCVDTTVPRKTIKLFSNNKPWVSKEIKAALNNKKLAFKNNNKEETISAQKEVKSLIRKGKHEYRKKIERYLECNNMKYVWDGLGLMSGRERKRESKI